MLQRTIDIVISYVGQNTVSGEQVTGMIESVYATLSRLGSSK